MSPPPPEDGAGAAGPGRRARAGSRRAGRVAAGTPRPAAPPAPAPSAPGASPTTPAPYPGHARHVRHRPASAHGPADGDLAGRGRAAPPRQPGSEQLIRPGQLNLMTAGHGVAHAEEDPGRSASCTGSSSGWRNPRRPATATAAFEHHDDLPRLELDGGEAHDPRRRLRRARIPGPARHRACRRGAECCGRRAPCCALRRDYEHALIVLDGSVRVGDQVVEPGVLAYLGTGREECRGRGAARRRAPCSSEECPSPSAPHVVELRGPDDRGGVRGPPSVGGRRRALRCGAILGSSGSRSGRRPGR